MAEAAVEAKNAKGGGMLMKLLMAVLFASAVGGGGGWYYFTHIASVDDEAVEAVVAAPLYWPVEPSFVVNLPDGAYMRYLKVDLTLMTRDPEVPALLEQHAPLLRNELLMLFSSADYAALLAAEGKERIRDEAIARLNARLVALGAAEGGIEALYFTNFVMQ